MLNQKNSLYTVFLLGIVTQLFACRQDTPSEWKFEQIPTLHSLVYVKHLDQNGTVAWGEIMTYGDKKITNYVAIDALLIEWWDYRDYLAGMPDEMREMYMEDMISLGKMDLDSFVIEVDQWFMSAPLKTASTSSIRDENIGYLLKDVLHEYELDDPLYAKKLFSFTNGEYTSVRSEKSFLSSGQDASFSYDVYRTDTFVARVRFYRCQKGFLTEQEILKMHDFVWDSLAGAFSYSLKNRDGRNHVDEKQ